MGINVILPLIAGLGLFLYGMKLMSDGLEKVAGTKLRKILEMCTKNRFIGLMIGLLFTAIIQSSSATTVLVVSFVNAGLLTLMQSVGVILGANIGTTVTAQLIAFNLSDLAPLFIMAGVIMIMFVKKPMIKRIGEVVLGFGILFFGMGTMSGSMNELKDSDIIKDIIASLASPSFAVLIGFLVTAVIQSSSATVGIVLIMAVEGFVNLPICFYLILGCNMGSCVTALLASIGGKKNAKRAAFIHLIINIIGSSIIFIILQFFEESFIVFIESLTSGSNIGRDVANTHLIFKAVQVIICFPLSKWIVKLTELIIRGKDKKIEDYELQFIGDNTVFSTTAAMPNAIGEIGHMAQVAFNNLDKALISLQNLNETLVNEVYETEKTIDFLNKSIIEYLVQANQLSLPIGDKKRLANLFHVVNDIERIGDHAENVADFTRQAMNDRLYFSDEANEEINRMSSTVQKLLRYSIEMFEKQSKDHLNEILAMENDIDEMERMFQHNHVVRLTNNECETEAGMIFTDLLSNLERIADHGTNIAFSILDEVPE